MTDVIRLTTIDYRLSTIASAIALLVCLHASQAIAQVIERPERPIAGLFGGGRPPDPARARHDLTLTVNTLGGYDDNPSPTESGGVDAFTPREPGYMGFGETALVYRRGKQSQSFEIGGRGFVNAFRNVGLTPGFGGDLHADLRAPLGRRHQLGLSASGRTDPFYTLGAFAPLRGDGGAGGDGDDVESSVLPDANPVNGFSIRRSLTGDAAVSLTSRWTPRNTMSADYQYHMSDFRDNIGDGHTHAASLGYTRSIGRRSGLSAKYRASDSEFLDQDGLVRPNRTQTADLGYQHEREVSRTRRLAFGFGAGATYVDTVSSVLRERLDYVMPSGYANTRVDVARTWSISANYRRAVSVLEGLTAESFITDTGLVRVGGFLGSRSELALSAAYSTGAAVVTESTAKFDSYTGTAQLRVMLTRWWAAVVSQNVYAYRLHEFGELPKGMLDRLDRNATRVGMTLNLPLYGGYISRRARPRDGR